ncbi:hypothetical protein B0H11DRAFT_1925618 [Mycena galericulata]|nr:hypothetical protein B0H11DRAFT_1925618 [Mycena galericulata]
MSGAGWMSRVNKMHAGVEAASTSGPRRYCTIAELAPYPSSVSITPAVFDIAVFVAILYRFVSNTHVNYTFSDKCRAFFSGVYLPSFSKALFVDGQKYYMITVISNIAMSAMIYAPGLSPGFDISKRFAPDAFSEGNREGVFEGGLVERRFINERGVRVLLPGGRRAFLAASDIYRQNLRRRWA